jgi:hypothetical protein
MNVAQGIRVPRDVFMPTKPIMLLLILTTVQVSAADNGLIEHYLTGVKFEESASTQTDEKVNFHYSLRRRC